MTEIYRRQIEEQFVAGKPLGRHVEHDPRSKDFLYGPARSVTPLVTKMHPRRIGILNQGDLGACTGNAGVGAIGTGPLYGRLPVWHPELNQTLAVMVYTAATKIDGVPGEMPADDTGSTGLAVAKVLTSMGLANGYQHTFSLDGALRALVRQPVLLGINWYEGFDIPNSNGRVWVAGEVRGGHEVVLDGIDVEHRLVWGTNSWGKYWGLDGRFCFGWAALDRLLAEDGDVVVPLRLPLAA